MRRTGDTATVRLVPSPVVAPCAAWPLVIPMARIPVGPSPIPKTWGPPIAKFGAAIVTAQPV